jgi:hypothetical protein
LKCDSHTPNGAFFPKLNLQAQCKFSNFKFSNIPQSREKCTSCVHLSVHVHTTCVHHSAWIVTRPCSFLKQTYWSVFYILLSIPILEHISSRYEVPLWHRILCIYFFFLWAWGLNLEHWTQGFCKASALPLEKHLQPILLWLFWRWSHVNYLPKSGLEAQSSWSQPPK